MKKAKVCEVHCICRNYTTPNNFYLHFSD